MAKRAETLVTCQQIKSGWPFLDEQHLRYV